MSNYFQNGKGCFFNTTTPTVQAFKGTDTLDADRQRLYKSKEFKSVGKGKKVWKN